MCQNVRAPMNSIGKTANMKSKHFSHRFTDRNVEKIKIDRLNDVGNVDVPITKLIVFDLKKKFDPENLRILCDSPIPIKTTKKPAILFVWSVQGGWTTKLKKSDIDQIW